MLVFFQPYDNYYYLFDIYNIRIKELIFHSMTINQQKTSRFKKYLHIKSKRNTWSTSV